MKIKTIDEMAAYTRINKFSPKDNVLTFMYDHNESVADSKAKNNTVAFDVCLTNGVVRRYVMNIDHYRGGSSMMCKMKAYAGEFDGDTFVQNGDVEDFGKVKITFEPDDAKKRINNVIWEVLCDIDSDYYDKVANGRNISVGDINYIRCFDEKTMGVEKYKGNPQYTITSNDARILMKNGLDDDDISFIQKCLDEHGVVFTNSSGNVIDAKSALRTLGSNDFLSGLERAAFNRTCSMGIGMNKVKFNATEWCEKNNVTEGLNEKRTEFMKTEYVNNVRNKVEMEYNSNIDRFINMRNQLAEELIRDIDTICRANRGFMRIGYATDKDYADKVYIANVDRADEIARVVLVDRNGRVVVETDNATYKLDELDCDTLMYLYDAMMICNEHPEYMDA
jgi:hypothetical protein